MNERWQTEQDEEKRSIVAGLESMSKRWDGEARNHKENAIFGVISAAVMTGIIEMTEHNFRRWGIEQGMCATLGAISLGAAAIELHFMRSYKKKSADAWQRAAQLWIENDSPSSS